MTKFFVLFFFIFILVSSVFGYETAFFNTGDNLSERINETIQAVDEEYHIDSFGVKRIIVISQEHAYYKGFYLIGGIIYLNSAQWDWRNTLVHELGHAYYFHNMSFGEQIKYCISRGFGGNMRGCWEDYAKNFRKVNDGEEGDL